MKWNNTRNFYSLHRSSSLKAFYILQISFFFSNSTIFRVNNFCHHFTSHHRVCSVSSCVIVPFFFDFLIFSFLFFSRTRVRVLWELFFFHPSFFFCYPFILLTFFFLSLSIYCCHHTLHTSHTRMSSFFTIKSHSHSHSIPHHKSESFLFNSEKRKVNVIQLIITKSSLKRLTITWLSSTLIIDLFHPTSWWWFNAL